MRVPFSEYSTLGFYSSKKEQPFRYCGTCNSIRSFRSPSSFNTVLAFGNQIVGTPTFQVFKVNPDAQVNVEILSESISTDINGDGNNENFIKLSIDLSGNTIPGQEPQSTCELYIVMTLDGKDYYSDDFNICLTACYGLVAWNDCAHVDLGPEDCRFELDFNELCFTESTEEVEEVTKDTFTGNKLTTSSKVYTYNSANILGDNSLMHTLRMLSRYDHVIIRNYESGCEWDVSNFTVTKGGSECQFPITFRFLTSIFEKGQCCFNAFSTPFETDDNPDPAIDCDLIECDTQITETGMSLLITENPTNINPVCSLYINGQFVSNSNSVTFGQFGTYLIICRIGQCEKRLSHEYLSDKENAVWDCETNGASVVFALNGVTNPSYEVFDSSGSNVGTSSPFAITDPLDSGNYTIIATWTDSQGNECQLSKVVALAINSECDFDFEIVKNNGVLSINWLTAIPTNPQYLWQFDDGTNLMSLGTAETEQAVETGGYFLTVTSGDCTKKSDCKICIVPTTGPIQVEIVGDVNVVICNTCEKPVKVCMCPEEPIIPDVTEPIKL